MNLINQNLLKEKIDKYFLDKSNSNIISGGLLIAKDNKRILSKTYGMANFELSVPINKESKFRIGSITKQFTAAIILLLVEKKKLKLDDKVNMFLDIKGEIGEVLITELLSHTSGIYNYTDEPNFIKNMGLNMKKIDFLDEISNKKLAFKSKGDFLYSNTGYVLLGYIIEKVTNISYFDLIQKEIFDKCDMRSSGYDDYRKIIFNRVSGYREKKSTKVIENSEFINSSIPFSAGGLYSTLEDLMKWNTALFAGEIISKNSLQEMTSKKVKTKNGYYGYGVFINDIEENNKKLTKIWHSGTIPGFRSCNSFILEENLQIVLYTNIYKEGFGEVVQDIERIVIDCGGDYE